MLVFACGAAAAVCFSIPGRSDSLPQKVSTAVSVYDDLFLTESGLLPLPKNAVELEREREIVSEHFRAPLKLAEGPAGTIYAVSMDQPVVYSIEVEANTVTTLVSDGRMARALGRPAAIAANEKTLAVFNDSNKRLIFLDPGGRITKNVSLGPLHDLALGIDGRIGWTPFVTDAKSPLASVRSSDREEIAFGRPFPFARGQESANARSIAFGEKGDVFIAFKLFPIIRKFSPTGVFLGEYRIPSPTMEAKEAFNLKQIGEGIVNPSKRGLARTVIAAIRAAGGRIYLLGNVPRLEIAEMAESGEYRSTYWIDSDSLYDAVDFLVRETADGPKFFVSRAQPPSFAIDVFGARTKDPREPNDEIAGLNDEVRRHPDDALAYNNRGVAKHRIGDFRGAVADYTKAIGLKPDFALAWNNRGLSRSRMNDLKGAAADFTESLALDPGAASVYYNRGIVRERLAEYALAIVDFEAAARSDSRYAAKAREQIDLCRKRLK
jgi:tetratricopeptide (TPR) repeat protein